MLRPINVLLVEDNEADAFLTTETLAMSKLRIDITVLADGALALAYLLQEPPYENAEIPELILLDLNLPKIDGAHLLAEIRGRETLRRIPVVVLTSSDAEQDIIKSYDLGANCYVTKPVGIETFQSIVRSVEHFWFTIVRLP
ncbi:MAG: response regulator [Rhodospirillales bacterium]|nr:response regulator [Rhodospirillales bacterium]